MADCASIIFEIITAKMHNFLHEHCRGIISKLKHFLENKFIKVVNMVYFLSTEIN